MRSKVAVLLCFLFAGYLGAAQEREKINLVLDSWHRAAATARFQDFFDLMAPEAVFVGTDASENWSRTEFMEFSKPYFDRGKAWDFTAVQRNLYLSADGEMAWFDELLDTWMLLCRGSGVVVKTESGWKIAHYVLSATIPNDRIQEAIELKRESESQLLKALLERN